MRLCLLIINHCSFICFTSTNFYVNCYQKINPITVHFITKNEPRVFIVYWFSENISCKTCDSINTLALSWSHQREEIYWLFGKIFFEGSLKKQLLTLWFNYKFRHTRHIVRTTRNTDAIIVYWRIIYLYH